MKQTMVAAALLVLLLAGCGSSRTSELEATVVQLQAMVGSVQTELAAKPTSLPPATETPVPTPTLTPLPTGTSTPSRTPTLTPAPSPTSTPTPAASPTPSPSRAPTKRPASPTAAATKTPSAPASDMTGRIVFAVYNSDIGSFSLHSVRPDGSDLRWIADYVHQPDISPDGQRVLVNGWGGGLDSVYDISIDGGEWQQWRQKTDFLEDSFPTWSVDGQHFLVSSSRQGDGVVRLYADWGPIGTDLSKFIVGGYSFFLGTGEVLFNGCDYGWGSDTHCGTWRAVPGKRPQAVTDHPRDLPMDVTWSEFLFLRPDGENWDVYRAGLDGSGLARLTSSPARDGPAALSPNGSTVAFLSDRSGTWALYTMDRQGGSVQKRLDLPRGGSYDVAPVDWTDQRISWGARLATPVPTPVGGGLLPAPTIEFPIWDDVVTSTGPTPVRWSWSGALGANQGFQIRFWHDLDSGPRGITAPLQQTELVVYFGATESFKYHGDSPNYNLDVVVVQIEPYEVLSLSSPIPVKVQPNK